MRLIQDWTKFNFLDLLELFEIFDTLPLLLSKNSWSLLKARKTSPVELTKNSVYMPSWLLYCNGTSLCR